MFYKVLYIEGNWRIDMTYLIAGVKPYDIRQYSENFRLIPPPSPHGHESLSYP